MPSSNEGLPPPAQSLPPGDPRRHIAPIHRALTMLEHNVPILQHREPLPPYAVNFKGTAPRVRSGSLQYTRISQPVGPTNPHRPWSATTQKHPESDVSRHAPYGARLQDTSDGYARTLHCRSPSAGNISSYNSLTDPHLQAYFVNKFKNPHPPKGSGRPGSGRPGSARSRLGSAHGRQGKNDYLYKVTVITGDRKNAGTDSKVYIRFQGSKGKIPKQLLAKQSAASKKKKAKFKFKRASTHTFKIHSKDIGDLKTCNIEHDGLTKADGWFLDRIEVVRKDPRTGNEKSWVFLCKQWLSLHEGDCQLQRQLFAKSSTKTEYEAVVITGNEKGAGTDANVSITIYGKAGNTPKFPLKSSTRNSFDRNRSDIFHLKTQSVGPLTKIRIEHDNTGFGPGWFLDRVVVTDKNNPKSKFYFPCGQWLAKDEGDGTTYRDLLGSKDPLAVRKVSKYKVTTFTGDKRGAGTDANVSITLFGESGDSGEKKLDNSKNNFEKNKKDEFTVECPCVGPITRIRIGHDNSGVGPGWYLNKVIVDDLDMGKVHEFPCERWFSLTEDDGCIARDLIANVGPMDAAPGVPYTINVMTGDVMNAGTSARVYITMFGGKGGDKCSGKIWLDNGKFARGRTDIFNVEVATILSPLSRIEIGHDDSGPGAGWYLDRVMVNCPSAGIEQWFLCNKWFATDEGDGLIERTLYENKTMRKTRDKKQTWFVWVYTSDVRGAGTDANVHLVAYGKTKDGEYKKSDEIVLDNKGDNFESGQTDKFKIEMIDIGKPYKIRVGHDNAGSYAAWHLDRIELENMQTKKRYTFKCGRWMAKDEEDGAIMREMPAEGEDIKRPQPLVNYNVAVHTGKKRGAGTDANVFLNVFGEQGDTGERALVKSSTNKNKFEKGNVDEFTLEAVTLKRLKRIRIGHDGTKAGDGWFLEKVVIADPDGKQDPVEFECNRWLDVKEDDGLIVREITAGGSQLLATTSYHVSVKTGDVRGAGTDANVTLKIFGDKGDTGDLALQASENNKNKFERGRTDLFKPEASDIGKIEKIRIGHDGKGAGSGWFLDEVRIDVPSLGDSYVFACHRWLDEKEGDGLIEIELEPTEHQKSNPKIPYEVTVWTGDVKGAGTDANVFLQMYGEYGKTEEFQLRNRTDNFEQAEMDKFKIEADDVGPLLKVRIGHDGAGMFAGWFLEKLLIQRHLVKGSKRRKRKLERRKSVIQEITRAGINYDDLSDEEDDKRRRGKAARARSTSSGRGGRDEYSDDERSNRSKSLGARRKSRYPDDGDSDDDRKSRKSNTPKDRRKSMAKGGYDSDSPRSSKRGTRSRSRGRDEDDFSDYDDKRGKKNVKPKKGSRYSDEESEPDNFRVRRAKPPTGKNRKRDEQQSMAGQRKKNNSDDEYDGRGSNLRRKPVAPRRNRGNSDDDFDPFDDDDDARSPNLRRKSVAPGRKKAGSDDEYDGRGSSLRQKPVAPRKNRGNSDDDFDPFDDDDARSPNLRRKSVAPGRKKAGSDDDSDGRGSSLRRKPVAPRKNRRHSDDDFDPFDDDARSPNLRRKSVAPGRKKAGSDDDSDGRGSSLRRKPVAPRKNRRHSDDDFDPFDDDARSPNLRRKSVAPGRKKAGSDDDSDGRGSSLRRKPVAPRKNRRHSDDDFDPFDDDARSPNLRRKSVAPGRKKAGSDDDSDGRNSSLRRKSVAPRKNRGYSDDEFDNTRSPNLRRKSVAPGRKKAGSDDDSDGRNSSLRRKSFAPRNNKGYSDDEFDKARSPNFRRKSVAPGRKKAESDDDSDDGRSSSLRRKSVAPRRKKGGSDDDSDDARSPSARRKSVAPRKKKANSDDDSDGRSSSLRRKSVAPRRKKGDSDNDSDGKSPRSRRKYVAGRKMKADSDDDSDGKGSIRKRKQSMKPKRKDSDDEDNRKKGKNKYLRDFKKEKEDRPERDDKDDDEDGGNTEDYWFVCNKWFAKNEDDGLIVRELLPTDENGKALDTGLSEVEYTVTIFTGDVFGAGTDANVFVNLTGEYGDTGEREMKKSNNVNKFERKQEDEFVINAIELGRIKKLKIRHDNKGGGAAWFLGHVEVTNSKTGETTFFPCQRWLSTKEDDGQIARELVPVDKSLKKKLSRRDSVAIRNEIALETKAALTTYHLYVHTGDKRGAGTDANVYVTLFGEIDDTGHVFLKSSKTNRNKFERNQMDEFLIEAVEIGDLKKLRIGHDNAGGGAAWHLDRVEVDCPSLGKKWFFPCGRWFGKGEDDGKIERDLFPQDIATEEYVPSDNSSTPGIPYEITTYTSDVSGAGTDADVYVVLYGRDLCTQQMSLCPNKKERKKRFERNCTDKFVVEMEDVGESIEKMRIGHDGTGWGAGWHLGKIEIRRLKDIGKGSETFTFTCDRWLARGEDDSAIERELVPDKIVQESTRKDGSVKKKEIDTRGKLESKKYVVEVFTGDVRGAGTDANVFCIIFGDRGDTGERKLHKSETNSNKFERGQTDRFTVEAVDLGRVYKMKIRHDNAMFSPDWFLDRVEVTDTADRDKYVFHCERWLGKKKDDGKLERSLYVKGYEGDRTSSTGTLQSSRNYGGSMSSLDSARSTEPFSKSPRMARRQLEEIPEGPTVPYTVKILTGSEKDQGTESNAWIKIMGGKKKHSGKLYLELAQKSGFLPGSIETFSLEAVDVEEVKQIELGHDGVTSGSGWFVKEVEVDMPTKGKHYYFTCNTWLARDKGDGKTSKTFMIQDGQSSVVSYKPMVPYEATFITGDVKDAGTDAEITMRVFGENGTTSDIKLDKASDRFERARNDFIKLELEDIAPLKKMRLTIDGKSSRPEWFLELVTLRNMDTGDLTTFKAGKWFSRTKEEGRLSHDFVAVVKGKEQLKSTSYKITVKTSDVRGAGTDANVYVCIFGSNGDSGDIHLKESSTNKSPFENNQTDVFTFPKMYHLGQLTKLRVWHDNKGLGAAWHLSEIEVEDSRSSQKFLFPCNRWLSRGDDDKQICRELACANLQSPGAKDKINYEIAVTTTDKKDAGMIHHAWLILEGEERTSKEFVMENSTRNKVHRRGQTDVFTMNSRNLGSLERCILGAVEREDKPLGRADGREASWHCYDIVVTNKTTGDRYSFPCKTWIPIGPKISRKYAKTLDVGEVKESKLTSLKTLGTVKYEVTVVTGDVSGAGTDANVFILIYGTNGDTGKRPLQQKFRNLFERKQVDKFQLEAVDLGDLTKIQIEHDNSGFGASWFLERVEIRNMVTDHRWLFPCAKWLDRKKGDGLISRELLPRD